MRRSTSVFVASLLSAAVCVPYAAYADRQDAARDSAAPRVMDLAALTHAAERSYPGLRAAHARLRAARAQLGEAWVSPFFQSYVTAGITLAPEVRGSPIFSPDPQLPLGNPWQPVLGLAIEGIVPLWTFGKLPAARDAARSGVRAAEADQARVRAQLRYDLRRAYFALQLALDLKQMLAEGLPQVRDAAARLDEQIADGDPEVSNLDSYRLETALAELEAREADADRLEHTTRAALAILTGVRRFEIPACPSAPIEIALDDRNEYVERGPNDRPESRMLDAAVRARQASLDVSEAGFFPDIVLAYRFGTTYAPGITDQTNPFVIDQANYTSLAAGLVARWSLDLWGNAHRVDRQSALLDDTRSLTQEAQRGMALEIADAYEAVGAAQRQVVSWERGRRAARRWFIASAQGRSVGTVEPRDLVDAARTYFTHRFGYLSAIRDLNTALANLERAAGRTIVQRWEPPCD